MAGEGMDYPFHLGVTEAGGGEKGRGKSGIGLGALPAEGIGDTVRVSLTEDPVEEIPVARALIERFNRRSAAPPTPAARPPLELRLHVGEARDPFTYSRRASGSLRIGPQRLGHGELVLVESSLSGPLTDRDGLLLEALAQATPGSDDDPPAELVSVEILSETELPNLAWLRDELRNEAPACALSARLQFELLAGASDELLGRWLSSADRLHVVLAGELDWQSRALLGRLLDQAAHRSAAILLETGTDGSDMSGAIDLALEAAGLASPDGVRQLMLSLSPSPRFSPLHAFRLLAAKLSAAALDCPILLLDRPADRDEDPLLAPATVLGGLLCDGIGDAIQIAGGDPEEQRRLAFGILQGARIRMTRTEFISCPSCGRTLFDLEETTARIRDRTSHLKGLKIAVMGCVVNGPGEMADADFGYVGWGENKIALFVGKEMVSRDIPAAQACDRLVELIKQHGRWVEPG